MKKTVLLTLMVGLVMWGLSGIIHNVILAPFYTHTGAKHEGIGILLLAYLFLAFCMVYLYSKLYQGGKPDIEGLKLGVFVGLLWVFPHQLAMAGAHGESLVYVFQNALIHVVEQGIGGVVLALLYEKLYQQSSDS